MDRKLSESPIYEFGPFLFDPTRRVLTKNGEEVRLTSKVSETLTVFIENPGKVLEKDYLMDRVWPDTVVEESNLSQNVSVLRKILGEKLDEHRYIVTIPGRGYRFVADVRIISPNGGAEDSVDIIVQESALITISEQKEEETEPSFGDKTVSQGFLSRVSSLTRVSKKSLVALTISILVISTASVVAYRRIVIPPVTQVTYLPKTDVASWKSEAGEEYGDAKLSPDAWKIAYSAIRDGHRSLYYKQIGDIGARENRITDGPYNDRCPIWSPDGRELAFVSGRGGKEGIWRIPFSGGTARLIKTVADLVNKVELKRWSRDGDVLYFESQLNIFALKIASGEVTQLTSLDKQDQYGRDFAISSDDNRLAYVQRGADENKIYITSGLTGSGVPILSETNEIKNPVWSANGSRVLYSSQRQGFFQIVVVDINNGRPEQLTFDDNNHFIIDAAINGNGERLLFNSTREESNIWGVDVDSRTESEITSDIAFQFWPDPSPDGNRIAFQSSPNMSMATAMQECAILTRPVDNSNHYDRLTVNAITPQWSPDGNSIGFLRKNGGKWNLWVISSTGTDERQLTTDGIYVNGYSILPYNRMQCSYFRWSPDSTKIVYSTSGNNKASVWVAPIDGSKGTMVTESVSRFVRFHCPTWSTDGRYFAGVSREFSVTDDSENWNVWITDTLTMQSRSIFRSQSSLQILGWSNTGNSVVISASVGKASNTWAVGDYRILKVSVESGIVESETLLKSIYPHNIQLSPARDTVAFDSRSQGKDQISVLSLRTNDITDLTKNSDPHAYFSGLAWSNNGRTILFGKQQRFNIFSILDQSQ